MSGSVDEGLNGDTGVQSRRLDKWLWFARVVKSRTLAAGLIESGKARINRSKVLKSSHGVRLGDVVTVTAGPRVRILKVTGLGQRRGPPAEARLLYEDLSTAETVLQASAHPPAVSDRAPGTGRPTKRDRRRIERFRDL